MGRPSLLFALDCLLLLLTEPPAKHPLAALPWYPRLELEAGHDQV